MIYGNALIYGDAQVYGDADIQSNNDYCCFQSFGSENRTTTFFRSKTNEIRIKCGCYEGTVEEFEKRVQDTHGTTKYAQEYLAIIATAKIKFEYER